MKFKYRCLPIVLLLSGCAAKTGHQFLEEMSETQVASSLVSNVTTKAEVKEKYGDPEDIDFSVDGTETWLYKFIRSDAKGINYVPIASLFYRGTNDTIKKMKIVFNSQGVVHKYAFSQTTGETKIGAGQ